MVPPVFVALVLGAPLLALMGVVSALGEWMTEMMCRLHLRPSPLPGARNET